ncbi:MAG TPA: glycine cleavage T C-terminal barrel domain-containing protein, partial [Micromonosporaceae bacterium]|nr:glycine cleavage T C-terminal barrel domain-containing protein [Micromonosporaceae bacterium]
LTKRLLQILVTDPEPQMFHAEVVRRDGEPVGYIRAASYGHTLGGAVGLAMVSATDADGSPVPLTQAWIDAGTWTVEIGAQSYPAVASLRPLFDPKNEKIRI